MIQYFVAFFNKASHDVNLIAINWEKASNTINYPSARKSVGIIGEHTAKLIDFMVIEMIKCSSISMIITFEIYSKLLASLSGWEQIVEIIRVDCHWVQVNEN